VTTSTTMLKVGDFVRIGGSRHRELNGRTAEVFDLFTWKRQKLARVRLCRDGTTEGSHEYVDVNQHHLSKV
jgi:hypothetical protein